MNKIWLVMAIAMVCISQADAQGLKQTFDGAFLVGSALSKQQILSPDADLQRVISAEFNSVTAENDMKWERIHPAVDKYDFSVSDKLMALAQQHQLRVIGHTLVWHSQTPDWVFENKQGKPLTRKALLQRMQEHINRLAGRYKGSIYGWDVVNEALNEDGSLRDSKWRQIIGDDYIVKAFEFAHQADPKAQLYYNDYNLFKPEKRAGAIRILKQLLAQGIPITGIGMQGHYALGYPDLADVEESIIAYSSLGVEVMITELDVSVLPFPEEAVQGADVSQDLQLQAKYNPYPDGLPEPVQQQLAEQYRNLFAIFLRHTNVISRVTFWGVNDMQSWRNDWPMEGRTDYPLLLDRQNQPKPAYHQVIELAQ